MSIEAAERQIAAVGSRFPFVRKVETIGKTANTVKSRLEVSSALFIELVKGCGEGFMLG